MSKSHKTAHLSALVALIADATRLVEDAYSQMDRQGVPSLDRTDEHPLDPGPSDRKLAKAVQTIQGACAQLSASVGRPSHVMHSKFMSFYEPVCLRVALRFKIADILATKPEGMHVLELGNECGVDPRKLSRILRLLTANHVFREVSANVFANNRLSTQLLSQNPLTSCGIRQTEEVFAYSTLLPDVLADPEWGPSHSPTQTAFNKFTGHTEPVYLYYEGATMDGMERGEHFARSMVGWNTVTEAGAVLRDFPWGELGSDATICDVGGGVGDMSIQLAQVFPALKFKLQDLPVQLEKARTQVWPVRCPQALSEKRIEFKPIDFLAEPPIPGCTVYYMKNILHNWPDKECVQILSLVKKAMSKDSRLLIHDFILQNSFRVPSSVSKVEQAPEPLLPNYGAGRIRQYTIDIDMMIVLNSLERRLDEFIALGDAAGLQFVKLWEVGDMGLVEFRLPAEAS